MHGTIDRAVEEQALREHGLLGRGNGMGNALHAIGYAQLPAEARRTIELIMNGGPFPCPTRDGTRFGDRFGDLPSGGNYLEFTVPTPGVAGRGMRRIVARKSGVLFFTACHYERVQGSMSMDERIRRTAAIGEEWRNGFYVVAGMDADQRERIKQGILRLRASLGYS